MYIQHTNLVLFYVELFVFEKLVAQVINKIPDSASTYLLINQ